MHFSSGDKAPHRHTMIDPIVETARFLLPHRRERFCLLASSEKRRPKLRAALGHFDWFDPRYRRLLPAHAVTVEELARLLRSRGSEATCYVFSESRELDGRTMPLDEALDALAFSCRASILSCRPGKLAFYEAEDPESRCLLERE